MNINNIVITFLDSVKRFPQRPALEVNGKQFTYKELWALASQITGSLKDHKCGSDSLAGVLAYRSQSAFSGILGILASGNGYVPFNPNFPLDRTLRMLTLSNVQHIVVGTECVDYLSDLLDRCKQSLTLIFPDSTEEDINKIKSKFTQHRFVSSGQLEESKDTIAIENDIESPAYLLFTSGSTGTPKGIEVSHKNVVSYVNYISERYDINENDRCSQTFDMTFDLSVHDIFITWNNGACLCCLPKNTVMMPAKFINDNKLTIWFSVPSVPMFMERMRMLVPYSFPTLRISLFCGEALPCVLAQKWQLAANDSIVDNLYGPTEATIAITHYRWNQDHSIEQCYNNVVPIGTIFSTQKYCIIDQQQKIVEFGIPGELCLSGTQVTKEYLNNPEKTKSQYVQIKGKGEKIWYRTGDLVREDEQNCIYYHGRVDNQVKILGHRVELQEIDSVLRKVAKNEMALSVPWPLNNGSASGIVGFLEGKQTDNQQNIIEECKQKLPEYMVPSRLYFIEDFPLNSNGKLDRVKLKEMLEQGVCS